LLVVAPAPHRRHVHPLGPVRRALLLVEVARFGAVGVALQREGPVAQVRQERGRDAGVVVDDRALGEPVGIQHLVEVAELELAALDRDRDVGHAVLSPFFPAFSPFSPFSPLSLWMADRLASSAAMRSTTRVGSSAVGAAAMVWPAAFCSMSSSTRSRYSSR